MCPNFGHSALTSSFTKYKFLQVKKSFATVVNGLSILKLFKLSNGDLCFSYYAYSIYKVRKPRMTKLGQGVGVRAHYPIVYKLLISLFTSATIYIIKMTPNFN